MDDLSELALVALRSAELDVACDPQPLLASYGVGQAEWLAQQERVIAQIGEELARGETDRANLFSATYEQRRRELLGQEQTANDNDERLGLAMVSARSE